MRGKRYYSIIGASVGMIVILVFPNAVKDAPHPVEVPPSTVKPFAIPNQLYFANEPIPLSRLDVQEKLDREVLVNSYWQSNNLLMLKRKGI